MKSKISGWVTIKGIKQDGSLFIENIRTDAKRLFFRGRKLVKLDLSPISECQHLFLINLSNNYLEELDPDPFHHLKSLERLFLENNHLFHFDFSSLQHCANLEHISLEKNSFSEIDLWPLYNKSSLRFLNLQRNPIKEIDLTPLWGCRALELFKIDSGVRLIVSEELKHSDMPVALESFRSHLNWSELRQSTELFDHLKAFLKADLSPHPSGFRKEVHSSSLDMTIPPFYCQLCGIKHIAGTPRLQCENCARYVCVDSFTDMATVGRSTCPMCDSKLKRM